METVKSFFARRWKQMAGLGAIYVALEVGAVVFVTLWGVSKVVT